MGKEKRRFLQLLMQQTRQKHDQCTNVAIDAKMLQDSVKSFDHHSYQTIRRVL